MTLTFVLAQKSYTAVLDLFYNVTSFNKWYFYGQTVKAALSFLIDRVIGTTYTSYLRPDGGIGRRKGLKIPGWKHCAGSSPALGTKVFWQLQECDCLF